MKPSRNNAFTSNLCAITGSIRTSSIVIAQLTPQQYRKDPKTASDITDFMQPSAQIVIGSKDDAYRRASFSKARI